MASLLLLSVALVPCAGLALPSNSSLFQPGLDPDWAYHLTTSEPDEVERFQQMMLAAEKAATQPPAAPVEKSTECALPDALERQIKDQLSEWPDGIDDALLQRALAAAPPLDAAMVHIRGGQLTVEWKNSKDKRIKNKDLLQAQLKELVLTHQLPDSSFVISTNEKTSTKGNKLPIFSTVKGIGDFDILYPSVDMVEEAKAAWPTPNPPFPEKQNKLCWRGTLNTCEEMSMADQANLYCDPQDTSQTGCAEHMAKVANQKKIAGWTYFDDMETQFLNNVGEKCETCDTVDCQKRCESDSECSGFVAFNKDCFFRDQSPNRLVAAMSPMPGCQTYIRTPAAEAWTVYRNADSYKGADYKEISCDGCTIDECKNKCEADLACHGFATTNRQCFFKSVSVDQLDSALTPSSNSNLYIRQKYVQKQIKNWQYCSGRTQLVALALSYPEKVDAGFISLQTKVLDDTNMDAMRRELQPQGPLTLQNLYKYKYQVQIDGEPATWKFASMLSSGSVVLKQESDEDEFYTVLFKPEEHFALIKRDMSDLMEKLQWLQEHDDMAGWMANNAHEAVTQNLQRPQIMCYWATLLRLYSTRMKHSEAK